MFLMLEFNLNSPTICLSLAPCLGYREPNQHRLLHDYTNSLLPFPVHGLIPLQHQYTNEDFSGTCRSFSVKIFTLYRIL